MSLNLLLATLCATDRMELLGHAQPQSYRSRQMLVGCGAPMRSVLFVETGTIAASVPISDGEAVEVFVIGREGVTGGWSRQAVSDVRLVARSDVKGLSVDLTTLNLLAARRRGVSDMLADYGARLGREMAQNSACNLHHRVGPRLAKWLLRNDDREDGGPVSMTIQALADAMGVQERLVRTHLRRLEEGGLVETSRLWLRVLNRDAVQEQACGCYDSSRSVCDRSRTNAAGRQAAPAPVGRGCEIAA